MTDLTLSTSGVAGDERPPGPRRSVRVPYLIGAAALALATALVGVDSGLGRLYPAGTDLSGVVAATDLQPGDLLSASMVEAAPALPEGWREVGAVVRRGRYPSTLQVGDDMLAVPADGTGELAVTVVSLSIGDDGAVLLVSGGA